MWFKLLKSDALQIMGLKEGYSDAELKGQFRRLAKKTHPDMGGNDTRFREVKEAYDLLRKGGMGVNMHYTHETLIRVRKV